MRSYKFTYFDGQGRGEVCRLLFALSGTPFEDVRLTGDQWKACKAKTPFGMLPILEVDGGCALCDSGAIARFLGREFGFMGTTSLEAARIDMIMGCSSDLVDAMVKIMFEKDDAVKATLKETFMKEDLPKYVCLVEKMLCDKDWLVGNKVSVADVTAVQMFRGFISKVIGDDCTKKSEKICALVKRFEACPNVAKYLAARAETQF